MGEHLPDDLLVFIKVFIIGVNPNTAPTALTSGTLQQSLPLVDARDEFAIRADAGQVSKF